MHVDCAATERGDRRAVRRASGVRAVGLTRRIGCFTSKVINTYLSCFRLIYERPTFTDGHSDQLNFSLLVDDHRTFQGNGSELVFIRTARQR